MARPRSPSTTWLIGLALGAFMCVSVWLYASVDSNEQRRRTMQRGAGAADEEEAKIVAIRRKIETIRASIYDNRAMLAELSAKIGDGTKADWNGAERTAEVDEQRQTDEQKLVLAAPATHGASTALHKCSPEDAALTHNSSSDVQMLSVYDILAFDNPEGGVWKQGWPIEYDVKKVQAEKRLEVIVIPHSHNDPGWLKTFEEYFEEQTRHILDLMVAHLGAKPDLRFIYAEMSFLELWWGTQSPEVRDKVKKFLQDGQFEVVTGGWVMTDEANAHFFATIMELFEGHEFLQNQLDYVPRHHWSIDPFGLSPTLAHILHAANLTHMAVQRVHYAVKKHLARHKQLEFAWRQMFTVDNNNDMRTHMFPFYSYDAPHSCGPDPKVCCQFDFRRLRGAISCPWGVNPVAVNAANVGERAALLADQYRKKAQLYAHNTLLVPLGDDFRYDLNSEWTDQYTNYKALFEHMNANKEWNINARFGTLGDYFALMDRRIDESVVEQQRDGALRHSVAGKKPSPLPVLSGDFFTYADRDDHYWSGYFTSRPFYKHMDRSLQHLVRAADIFYALARWRIASAAAPGNSNSRDAEKALDALYNGLVSARRTLSLFQHHDGVTGTARTRVVLDYGEKMARALADSKRVLAHSVESLLALPAAPARADRAQLRVDEAHFVDRLPEKFVAEDGAVLIAANALAQWRTELICVHVASEKARVSRVGTQLKDKEEEEIPQQIGPLLYVDAKGELAHFADKFELCFRASLAPLGLARFQLIESNDLSHKVRIQASPNAALQSNVFSVDKLDDQVNLENAQMSASFDARTGLLKSIRTADNANLDVEVSFVKYGARAKNPARDPGGDSLSGAYLFLPDGPAQPLAEEENALVLVKGPVRQYVFVRGAREVGLRHTVALDAHASHLTVLNRVNLGSPTGSDDRGNRAQNSHQANTELAMRVRVPSIQRDNFFTDLNAFQMIRRRRQAKLPLQAHFYPMPGAAFVENDAVRVSLLGRQALGVASLANGEMQVMLDRRLRQDDDRGLGQGVEDNVLTESSFRIHVEHFSGAPKSGTVGFHSLAAHHSSLQLHYPPVLLTGPPLDHSVAKDLPASWTPLRHPFPCTVHAVALRTLSHPTVYGNEAAGPAEPLATPENNNNSSGSVKGTNRGDTRPRREVALVLHRLGRECALATTPIGAGICTAAAEEIAQQNSSIDLWALFSAEFAPRSVRRGALTLMHPASEREGPLTMDPMDVATLRVQF